MLLLPSHWRNCADRVNSRFGGCSVGAGVPMRIVGAVLALLLGFPISLAPAVAQNDNGQSGSSAKPASQSHKFRTSASRPAVLRARAAARRAHLAAEHSNTAAGSGEGSIRTAAAASRRRAPPPQQTPTRDASALPLADR